MQTSLATLIGEMPRSQGSLLGRQQRPVLLPRSEGKSAGRRKDNNVYYDPDRSTTDAVWNWTIESGPIYTRPGLAMWPLTAAMPGLTETVQ